MAASIVYNGAMTMTGGGSLFDGMKFWVAQRIPMRSYYLDMIRSNGGQTVESDKLADVMIADHAHKSAPPGSYSWRFIAESVKKGKLEKLEDHPAGPARDTPRHVGSSRPPKGTRTDFTAEDDRVLAQWVLSAVEKGLYVKGNAIYQQLENINPRHTFQSWRDRWIKYGQFQQRADSMPVNGASGPSSQRLIPNRSTPQRSHIAGQDKPLGSRPRRSMPTSTKLSPKRNFVSAHVGIPPRHAAESPRAVLEQPKSPAPSRKSPENQPFTQHDRDLLRGMYEDIMNIDETKIFEAWDAFANAHPQHGAQEWYKCWIENVKPSGPFPRKKNVKEKPIQSSSKIQNLVDSPAVNAAKQRQTAEVLSPSIDPLCPRQTSLETPYLNEEVFECYLILHLKNCAEDQGPQIDLEKVVGGKKIRLYDLWRVVNHPEPGGYNAVEATRTWGDVAQQLGLKNVKSSNISTALKAIYDSLLAGFSEVMALWPPDPSIWKSMIGEDDVLDKEKLLCHQEETHRAYKGPVKQKGQRKEESTATSEYSLEIPSSPPILFLSSAKRKHLGSDIHDQQEETLEISPTTPRKRQRFDKGKGKLTEIPSTPEDRLRFRGIVDGSNALTVNPDLTPTRDIRDDFWMDDEETMFISPESDDVETSNLEKALRKAHVDPETQDFHFPHSQDSTTISQGSHGIISGLGEGAGDRAGSSRDEPSVDSQEDSQDDPRAFVEHLVSLGYPEETVIQALLATTMETGDVATVMESMMRGEGTPANIEGVWTEDDDKILGLPQKGKRYQRLVAKHGEARCVQRRQFLSEDILKDIKWDRYRNIARSSAS